MPRLRPHYLAATNGNRIAADLLERILFWMPKAKACNTLCLLLLATG
jgi:hypothetical protein